MNEPEDRIAEKLIAEGFPREETEALSQWVSLTTMLCLDLDLRVIGIVKDTIKSLTNAADKLYAELMNDERDRAVLTFDDMGEGWLSMFGADESITKRYLEATGTLLFKGQDGPRATEVALGEAIDRMVEHLSEHPDLQDEIRRRVIDWLAAEKKGEAH